MIDTEIKMIIGFQVSINDWTESGMIDPWMIVMMWTSAETKPFENPPVNKTYIYICIYIYVYIYTHK